MSTTNILDLNNRIDALEKAVSGGDSAQANKKDIATEFNTTTAYTAGCFVYYKGKLYQFNADHAAGAWDPTDVVEANVTDQIVSNKAAIDGLTASDIAYDNTDSGMTATDVQGAVDETADSIKTINAKSYHTTDYGAKIVTLSNPFQQVCISINASANLTIYMVVQRSSFGTLAENIYSTQTGVDINVTHVDNNSFTINLPQYAQTNIFSTEAFTVSAYTPTP